MNCGGLMIVHYIPYVRAIEPYDYVNAAVIINYTTWILILDGDI